MDGKAIGPQPAQIHSGRALAAPMPHPFDNPVARRAEALKYAVETMRTVQKFTNYQVVHTAALYDQFLENGATPPSVTEEDPDAEV